MNEVDVLLNALQSPIAVVRDAAIRGLSVMSSCFPSYEENYDDALRINKRIWIACYDTDPSNRDLAQQLWGQANLSFPTTLCKELLSDIEHPVECIQIAAAESLGSLLISQRELVKELLKDLLKLYNERLQVSFICPIFFYY